MTTTMDESSRKERDRSSSRKRSGSLSRSRSRSRSHGAGESEEVRGQNGNDPSAGMKEEVGKKRRADVISGKDEYQHQGDDVSPPKEDKSKGMNYRQRHQEEVDDDEVDEEPPKPVSSSSEDSEEDGDDEDNKDDASDSNGAGRPEHQRKSPASSTDASACAPGTSRLFRPYRTVGIVSSGRPFHLIPHQSSESAMVCVPIRDRFQLLQTDRLHPVMVSQTVPAATPASGKGGAAAASPRPEEITHCCADATLSITVVAHGACDSPAASTTVTLFHRTQPYRTISLSHSGTRRRGREKAKAESSGSGGSWWSISDLLHLGHIKVTMSSSEKKGRKENAVVVAAVLARHRTDREEHGEDGDDGVPLVGDDDDDDDDDDTSEEEENQAAGRSSGDEEQDDDGVCSCQVVVLVATRTSLQVQERIRLLDHPSLVPVTSMHPATYLNKIVVAGFDRDEDRPAMILLNVRSGKTVHSFSCLPADDSASASASASARSTTVTAVEQSPAVDTVAVGTDAGEVHLVNLRLDRRLFSLRHEGANRGAKVAIRSISFRTDGSAMQYGIAPMAVGRSDGTITVWDLTPPEEEDDDDDDDDDENDYHSSHRQKKAATTGATGVGRTVLTEMKRVHAGGIAKIQYLPQEPLLLSTGLSSNAVTMHIFDSPDHTARLLRERRGHARPPRRMRYLYPGTGGGGILANASDGTDASACQILSGGQDRTLRVFSTVRTVLDREYSQGRGLEKRARQLGLSDVSELLLPPVTAMASAEARRRDWGDLVTIHEGHPFAYVWSTARGAQSGPLLKQPKWNVSAMKARPPRGANATAVAMSACGNFALVGTAGGVIYRYNVQSGHSRGSYPRDIPDDQDKDETEEAFENRKRRAMPGNVQRTMKALEKAHRVSNRASNLDRKELDAEQEAKREQRRTERLERASHRGYKVTGIAVDSVNKVVVSVGDDAKLILWHFATHIPHRKSPYLLPCAASRMCHIRDSDLAAVALEDYTVVLFDCAALAVVRRFGSSADCRHTGPITDLAFGPDGRNLFTSSMDGTIRVWDAPANACVDWLGFRSSPTSLAVSPTGEFLATTHAGKLGISLWSDRSYYQTVGDIADVGSKPLLEPAPMDDPVPMADAVWTDREATQQQPAGGDGTGGETGGEEDNGVDGGPAAVRPKESGLITLSGLPPSHWKNLFHLELVRERNKPKEPPKKPPSAPFFLQWRSGEALVADKEEIGKLNWNDDDDDGEWAAAWNDDDNKNNEELDGNGENPMMEDPNAALGHDDAKQRSKRRKVTHHRSHLASLLHRCGKSKERSRDDERPPRFQSVTDHVATLGPSAIDVSLSTLCHGMHDLDEGLPLLHLACLWLLECCRSRERFEAANAYLHRFLHLHAAVIAGIDNDGSDGALGKKRSFPGNIEDGNEDDDVTNDCPDQRNERWELLKVVAELRRAQAAASDELRGKMQHSLCLLRHFSRMV